jgi:hypothetical protein
LSVSCSLDKPAKALRIDGQWPVERSVILLIKLALVVGWLAQLAVERSLIVKSRLSRPDDQAKKLALAASQA